MIPRAHSNSPLECDLLRFPQSFITGAALLQGITFVVGDCKFDHHEPALATLSASQLRSLSHITESLATIERDVMVLVGMKQVCASRQRLFLC